jgi:hypothetical protein
MRIQCLFLALSALVALQRPALAEPEPAMRRLWDEAFRLSRSDGRPKAARAAETYVGLTVWRLRAADAESGKPGDPRFAADGGEWLAERVETDASLTPGERLRLGIESARRGYLYVLDSEEYADGTRGEPRLIFPTTRTRGGDNWIVPGRLVEIPDGSDTPPYFSVARSRSDHVADVLTILVAPRPLPGVRPTREARPVAKQLLETWERTYGAPAARLELPAGAGRSYTTAEHAAASSRTRRLTHDDPVPQTLFRVSAPARGGLLLHVTLGMTAEETP